MSGFRRIVMAGLDPAIPLTKARPCHMIGIAGSSPAMTACECAWTNPTQTCPYHPTGSTFVYFTCSSAKLDSIEAMPSSLVSFCFTKRS
jgi:hypothetical protein